MQEEVLVQVAQVQVHRGASSKWCRVATGTAGDPCGRGHLGDSLRVLGTKGFLVKGALPGLSAGSLQVLSGWFWSPVGLFVLAVTVAVLRVAEAKLGLAGALQLWLGLIVLRGCWVGGGSASGSTMQIPGVSSCGGGT